MSNEVKALSRRSFVSGAALGAAAIGGAALFGCDEGGSTPPVVEAVPDQVAWDIETDVVIVGYGYAGACAAIAARDAEAEVIVVEKAPHGGGNSETSVGSMHTAVGADDPSAWKRSRREQLLGTVPDATVDAYVDHAFATVAWLEDNLDAELSILKKPLDGSMMAQLTEGGKTVNGKALFAFLSGHAEKRGAQIMLSTPCIEIIQKIGESEVLGVKVNDGGTEKNIKARRGVVMSCGGYENNQAMQADYHYPGIPFVPWGTPYNTGDGIKLVQQIGADTWHFSCFEYAGLTPKKPYDELPDHPVFTLDYNSPHFYTKNKTGNFMIVNTDGKRFYDENTKVCHQKSTLPFNVYDEHQERYLNYPFFFLCDETMIKSAPLAHTPTYGTLVLTYSGHYSGYEWSKDNSAEIAKGWIVKADTIEELAQKLGIDAEGLKATQESFNSYAAQGADLEFNRPADTMAPLSTPPYYGVECLLSVINTMGGAVRNENCQILDTTSKVIPRLYGAGEFGSYNGGVLYALGNNTEAVTTGRVAGAHAASLESWETV